MEGCFKLNTNIKRRRHIACSRAETNTCQRLQWELPYRIEAFILIWAELDRWRFLAYFISMPVIRKIASFAYKTFAHWRFKQLKHCQIADQNQEGDKTSKDLSEEQQKLGKCIESVEGNIKF